MQPATAAPPTTTTAAIEVSDLRRSYGDFEAVRGISFEVRPGEVLALLGVNGAGKTSALEVLEGLAPAGGGTVRVLGMDPVRERARVRRELGVLLQTSGLPGDLTVAETLRAWAGTLTDPRPVEEALAQVSLTGRADVRVRALSGGERRRLDLAMALLGRPSVVVLDEPTTGLDPESRRQVWELVQGLVAGGAAVLLTTHHLEEAEELADRVAVMRAGRSCCRARRPRSPRPSRPPSASPSTRATPARRCPPTCRSSRTAAASSGAPARCSRCSRSCWRGPPSTASSCAPSPPGPARWSRPSSPSPTAPTRA